MLMSAVAVASTPLLEVLTFEICDSGAAGGCGQSGGGGSRGEAVGGGGVVAHAAGGWRCGCVRRAHRLAAACARAEWRCAARARLWSQDDKRTPLHFAEQKNEWEAVVVLVHEEVH